MMAAMSGLPAVIGGEVEGTMEDGRYFSISGSLESGDERGELTPSISGCAVFSGSGREEIEERAVDVSLEFGV